VTALEAAKARVVDALGSAAPISTPREARALVDDLVREVRQEVVVNYADARLIQERDEVRRRIAALTEVVTSVEESMRWRRGADAWLIDRWAHRLRKAVEGGGDDESAVNTADEAPSRVSAALWGLYYALYHAPADWWRSGNVPTSVVRAYGAVQSLTRTASVLDDEPSTASPTNQPAHGADGRPALTPLEVLLVDGLDRWARRVRGQVDEVHARRAREGLPPLREGRASRRSGSG
jgi:hypothetical protein